jgi:D-glycero-D-manno-heptose 1,7-bisphosphate phosphatase
LRESWMVGDMLSDILAGANAGCRSILVQTGNGHLVDCGHEAVTQVGKDVLEAARIIVGERVAGRCVAEGSKVISEKESN